jgi:predicted dehydrogenase
MKSLLSSRRKFIGQTAGALAVTAAALQAPFILTTPAQEPQKKLGFALVGLGNLSTNQIAPALQKTKNCRLAAIVSGTPQKLKDWSAKYDIPEKSQYNYDTFDKIKDNPEVDVIYVVLPNSMHAEYTVRAAQAGKHVLCEKPMEISSKKCQQMIKVCKEKNVKLAIGYRCQFVPHHLEIMRYSREKTFGEVKLIEASFGFRIGDPKQWRLRQDMAGGGALMDVGIYALQAARYVARQEPTELVAYETKTDKVKFKEVDESVFWNMKFPNGIMANCGTTYLVNGMNRVFAAAEQGWFQLDPAYSYGGLAGKTSKGPLDLPQVDHFATEMDDFAECIINNRQTKVPGEEGWRDVRIMEAIYESISKGGKSIKLPRLA